MRALYNTLLLACMLLSRAGYSQFGAGKCDYILQSDSSELVFDRGVSKMVIKDHHMYIGGSFTTVGKFSGTFIELNRNTGAAVNRRLWPKVVGQSSAIPDGKGGHIVFGNVRSIGDIPRSKIGIIDKNGEVTSFALTIDSTVRAAVLSNGILYIGGHFTSVNGQTRNRLAAIDMSTGNLLPWNPDVKNTGPLPCRVECMLESNGSLYVGGAFSHVGTSPRKNIAAINSSTGVVNSWAPDAYFGTAPDYGNVTNMLKVNNMLYICGGFDVVAGSIHPDVAAIDMSTGVASSWKPDPNSVVFSLASKGDTLYLGGAFYEISGQPRYSFAAYSISTGDLLPVIINTKQRVVDQVYTILPVGDTLYLGGLFDTTNSQCRKNIAAFNRSTGTLLSFTSHTNAEVKSLGYDNNRLYAAGRFISVDRKLRNYLAAIDMDVDTVTAWYPKVNNEVNNLRIINDKMYIMGTFTRLNDSARQYAATLNTKDWSVTKWHPKPNLGKSGYSVNDVVIYKNDIYIAGDFDTVNGQSRNGIAKVDTLGNLHPWIGITGNDVVRVNAIEVYKDTLYAGGFFKNIGGQDRLCFGAVNLVTGLATSLIYPYIRDGDPVEFDVIRLYGDSLYVAYLFEFPPIGAPPPPTHFIEKLHLRYRKVTPLGAMDEQKVRDIYVTNSQNVYVVGHFKGHFISYLFNKAKGIYTSKRIFRDIPLAPLYTTVMYGNRFYIGGAFGSDSMGYMHAASFLDPLILAEVDLVTDTNSVCKGVEVTVRAQSTITHAVSYEWYLNGTRLKNNLPYYTYKPTDKDSIQCIVADQPNICRWDIWDTSNVIVYNVMPVVTPGIIINGPAEEQAGKTVTIKAIVKDADTGYTIEWFNRGVSLGKTKADSISYVKGIGKDSIYAVITPRTDTCYVTDTSSLIVVGEKEDETSIRSANGGDDRVMIYPNPFDTYIKVRGVEQGDVLLLYDVTGRKVSSTQMTNSTKEYLLSTAILNAGVYVLKLIDKEGLIRKTMLIQKQGS